MLRLERGTATPEELAAVLVVLLRPGYHLVAAAPHRSRWAASARPAGPAGALRR